MRYFIYFFILTQSIVFSKTPQDLGQSISSQQTESTVTDTSGPVVSLPDENIQKKFGSIQARYIQLFQREDIQFDANTFDQAWKNIQLLFSAENKGIRDVQKFTTQYFSTWDHTLNVVVAILILIVISSIFSPLRRYLRGLREKLSQSEMLALNTLGYLLEIIVRALPTLLLTLSIWLVTLILELPAQMYLTILNIIGIFLAYKLARWLLEVIFAPEEIRDRLVPCDTGVARFYFHVIRTFLQWTLLYAVVLFLLNYLGFSQDFRSFIKFIYRSGAVLLFGILFIRRDFTFSLFPAPSKKFYENLLNFFRNIYYPIYGILVFSGILSILGYTTLSGFIFSRVFITAGVILVGGLLRRILLDTLDSIIPEAKRKEEEEEEQKGAQFWNRLYSISRFSVSAFIVLVGILLIAKAWWLLGEQSIFTSLISFFTFTLFQVQDTPITIWSLIKAVLVVILFVYISKNFRKFLQKRVLEKTSLDRGATHAILTLTHYIILVIAIVVALESIGIQLTTLKVFAGALGLGIGFGLQNIANNFASGLIILFERPIKTKDFVHVGDVLGTITNISARSTTIQTRDNIAIIVPNSDFIEKTVVNWSLNDTPTRIHVPIGVEYGTDPKKVEEILLMMADKHPRALSYPKPKVWFKEFGDSSLDFELLVWINDPQEGVNNIQSDINFQIAEVFKDEGIGIPFPQRDVHFKIDSDDIEIIRKLINRE